MRGILLVSHSTMCVGVKDSLEMIMGPQEVVDTISLGEDGVESFRAALEDKISKMNETFDEIIIVTDIPNATPYNECFRYIRKHEVDYAVVAGMNLAMVIELAIFSQTDMSTEDLVNQAMETGKTAVKKL
ncbi:PTS sugar transporter subunit IIA [Tannockella kyphosi]|uniref:PTS sugar transporter subunit IIA n=1 Tax=Tannockella kyphosi TaxID=2899121 RepID=UPI002013B298|nr:PTS fructose transporter subunit IIA [Tannockella kyphosi]